MMESSMRRSFSAIINSEALNKDGDIHVTEETILPDIDKVIKEAVKDGLARGSKNRVDV